MTHQSTARMDYWGAEQTLRATYQLTRPKKTQDSIDILQKMPSYAKRCQITTEEINNLNIIHVTGTKGKGSTCVLTESILHSYGYKTGLFMSPHLIETNERVRINGSNLEKDLFAKYFWEVHEKFMQTRDEYNGDIPYRFAFYTIFGLYVCIREQVDVCILEVGIGGETDCTNFIKKPWLCAITSIGLDHVDRLGDTREKIAWNKAGIFKDGATAFVGNIDTESVLQMIKSRAQEKNIQVYSIPELSSYETNGRKVAIGMNGDIQKYNASLALQLAKAWIDRRENRSYGFQITTSKDSYLPVCKPFPLTDLMLNGLAQAHILCRGEIIRKTGITYYLDSAHTSESVQHACDWFFENTLKDDNKTSGKSVKILIFDLLSWRDARMILSPLVDKPFDAVVFATNIILPGARLTSRSIVLEDLREMQTRTLECRDIWRQLKGYNDNRNDLFYSVQEALVWATQSRDQHLTRKPTFPIVQIADPTEGVDLKSVPSELQGAAHIHILVTGHSKLVGNAYCLARPEG